MKKRTAFTMIELVFVIIIVGIVGKFGVEFLSNAYKNFIFSKINANLQSDSQMAVEVIAKRLQYRIKNSLIARVNKSTPAIAIEKASGTDYKVLEWIGIAQESKRGVCNDSTPFLGDWSGIIDLDAGNKDILITPQTNSDNINTMISDLSYNSTTINDAAIYFIGQNSNIKTGYGWNGKINDQKQAMHPIKKVTNNNSAFTSSNSVDFSGVDVYEYYQLAWSAYAVVYEPGANNKGLLRLYYDYQPWNGETMDDGKSSILMKNVNTFQFTAIGSIIKIQICTKSDLVQEYSLCKEKTIL